MATNTTQLRDRIKYLANLQDKKEILAKFEEVAELLMNNCSIKKGEKEYEIVDIEFYMYNFQHPDVITYPRDPRDMEMGRWFFHPSGVDLTFFDSTPDWFGGILIRGIRNVNDGNDQIFGPQKCVEALWDNFNAFDNQHHTEYPIISSVANPRSEEIMQCPRWIYVPKGKSEIDKIREWKARINKITHVPDVSDEALAELVFRSPYRFVKINSIDKKLESWAKYSAKPKLKDWSF